MSKKQPQDTRNLKELEDLELKINTQLLEIAKLEKAETSEVLHIHSNDIFEEKLRNFGHITIGSVIRISLDFHRLLRLGLSDTDLQYRKERVGYA